MPLTLCTWEAFKQMESLALGQTQRIAADVSSCFITDFWSHRSQTAEALTKDGDYFEFQLQLLEQDGFAVFLTPMFDPPRVVVNQSGCKYWHYLQYFAPILNTWEEYKQYGIYFPFMEVTGDPFDASAPVFDVQNPAASGSGTMSQLMGLTTTTVIRFERVAGNIVLKVLAANADTIDDPTVWTIVGPDAEYTFYRPASATDDFTGATLLPVDPNPPSGYQRYEAAFTPSPANAGLHLAIVGGGDSAYSEPSRFGLHDVSFFTPDATPGQKIDCQAITVSSGCSPHPGMELWLKNENRVISGSDITGWTDSSGHAHHAGAGGGTPQVSTDLLNGLTGVKFNGSNWLSIPSAAALNFSDGYTLFIVHNDVAPSTGSQNHTLLAKDDGYIDGVWNLHHHRRSSDNHTSGDLGIGRVYIGALDVEGFNTTSALNYQFYDNQSFYETIFSDPNDGTPRCYAVRWGRDGDLPSISIESWADGQRLDTFRDIYANYQNDPSTLNPFCPSTQTAPLTIGCDGQFGSGGTTGTIWEVIIYSGKLTDAQIERTNKYLRNKFAKTKPVRTYSVPTVVGVATFTNTYTFSPPGGSQAGDLLMVFIKHYTEDTIDTANAPPGYAGPTPFSGYVPVANYSYSVGFQSGGETQRIRSLQRILQGSSESYTYKDFNNKTAPDFAHVIKVVAIRGLSIGGPTYNGSTGTAFGGKSPYNPMQGFDLFPRDISHNFEYEATPYLGYPPGGIIGFDADHIIDPIHVCQENSIILLHDAAVWSSASFTPPAGFTEIDDANDMMLAYKIVQPGSSGQLNVTSSSACRWAGVAWLFEGTSEAAANDPVPSC